MRHSLTVLAIAILLLLQACSTTNVVTSIVPGKELSRTSLGKKEIDNQVVIDEVDPLSVKLYRRVSSAEQIRTEYKALKETRHETISYNCTNAYPQYAAFLTTTFAVPVLYELFTNFDILRGMCTQNPPALRTETEETGKTLTMDSIDKEKVTSQDTPLAGESVSADVDGTRYTAVTSPSGIATFPKNEISSLHNYEKSTSIDYQYNDVRLATPYRYDPKKDPEAVRQTSAATGQASAVGDDADVQVARGEAATATGMAPTSVNESPLADRTDTMAKLDEQGSVKMAAKKSAPQTDANADPKLNALSRKMNANAPVPTQSHEEEAGKPAQSPQGKSDSMALREEQTAELKATKENKRQGAENIPANMNRIARKMNKAGQGYTNEDDFIRISQESNSIKIRNKSGSSLTLTRVTVHYNDKNIENLLQAPVKIPANSVSAELNPGNLIGGKFDDVTSFGIAAAYTVGSNDTENALSKVYRYDGDKSSEDPQESLRIQTGIMGMVAKNSPGAASGASASTAAEKDAPVSEPSEWKIILNIKFDTNKAIIKKEYFPRLKEIGKALQNKTGLKGIIEGHTDNVGNRESNRKLSVSRAEAVAQHLIKQFGIAPERLKVEGFGMSRPIADNSTPTGRAKNRRIEAKFKDTD